VRYLTRSRTWMIPKAINDRGARQKIVTDIREGIGQNWAFSRSFPPTSSRGNSSDRTPDRTQHGTQIRGHGTAEMAGRTLIRARRSMCSVGSNRETTRETRSWNEYKKTVEKRHGREKKGWRNLATERLRLWGSYYGNGKDGVLSTECSDSTLEVYVSRLCVRAFNDDKPFTAFIREQLAADQLKLRPISRPCREGFAHAGPACSNSQLGMMLIDDQIDVVGSGFIGLSLSCEPLWQENKYEEKGNSYAKHTSILIEREGMRQQSRVR